MSKVVQAPGAHASQRLPAAVLLAVLAVAVFLLLRNAGLYPLVFADEYTYSKLSRLMPLDKTDIPGYLYLLTYRLTNACGDGFLVCARVLNVAFFVAAAPFIYFTGTRVTDGRTASLVTVLAVAGPINSYTAYFMPESLYFLSFWIVTCLVISLPPRHSGWRWILGGTAFGASALIKPHALFLLPPLLVYFLAIEMRSGVGTKNTLAYLRYPGLFLASALATKLVVGFLLGGTAGLTLFGPSYTSFAYGSESVLERYVGLLVPALQNLQGHLLALCLLFSVPLAILLLAPRRYLRRDAKARTSVNLMLYTTLVLISLIAVVTFFTASVAGSGVYESIFRLHMRYYNFAFPLLLLVAASQLPAESEASAPGYRAVAAIPLGAAAIFGLYTQLAPYAPSLVDNPELRGFASDPQILQLLGGFSLLSLAVWIYSARTGARCFVYLFIPLCAVVSTIQVTKEMRQRLVPDAYDEAGLFAARFLSPDDRARTLVVGSDPAALFRSLFHLDHPDATLAMIPRNASYDLSALPAHKEWALVIGDHPLVDKAVHPTDESRFQISMHNFVLAKASIGYAVDFRKNHWPGIIEGVRGLSPAEAWGSWSSGEVVTIVFARALPARFTLRLVGQAFGPNAGKEVVARIGGSTAGFTLDATVAERKVVLDNPARSRHLIIEIPSPISPKRLGLSDDARELGIGFVEMGIEPL